MKAMDGWGLIQSPLDSGMIQSLVLQLPGYQLPTQQIYCWASAVKLI